MYKLTRSSYFWNHSSELDTLVNQNSHAAPIRSPVRGRTGFSKSRGLRASVTFFPLPHPAPSTFLLSPHFLCGPNAKTSFARPEFRHSGTLATQARKPAVATLAHMGRRRTDGRSCQVSLGSRSTRDRTANSRCNHTGWSIHHPGAACGNSAYFRRVLPNRVWSLH